MITPNTKFFSGQVLGRNNEFRNEETGEGGLSLWDVTNPLDAKVLTMHAGDPDAGNAGFPHAFNHIHSVFIWQQKRAFAVMTTTWNSRTSTSWRSWTRGNPVLNLRDRRQRLRRRA